jgi:ribosomal-protein-alanine N-acetyltransferase
VLTFRDFKPADFDEIHSIDQQCFEPGIAYSRMELQFYLKRKNAFTIVAEDSDSTDPKRRIAGFIIVEYHAPGFGHVITIDIRAEFRRTGLGTRLIEAAETRTKDMGGRLMILEVAVNNEPAIRFYKKHKYSIDKTIPRYYKGVLDALLMTKRLVPLKKDIPQSG